MKEYVFYDADQDQLVVASKHEIYWLTPKALVKTARKLGFNYHFLGEL